MAATDILHSSIILLRIKSLIVFSIFEQILNSFLVDRILRRPDSLTQKWLILVRNRVILHNVANVAICHVALLIQEQLVLYKLSTCTLFLSPGRLPLPWGTSAVHKSLNEVSTSDAFVRGNRVTSDMSILFENDLLMRYDGSRLNERVQILTWIQINYNLSFGTYFKWTKSLIQANTVFSVFRFLQRLFHRFESKLSTKVKTELLNEC